ncbi:serine/threonine-protein kinase [Subtercola boreus]|uniref:non-specific serine/threonine protein kinase n=1 Tax=Subtercola boreus TaxID=120213 RepID=A0A3E0WFD8_9MICO|nr:serine/threonine-protein kinase [Subtercola boreus]RFA22757.1 hypothetical protein B7R24_03900 [Subtercola boreus]RFA23112.1 hypothetical protein B7R23_03895 [Subtercola boreus]RFA28865.1 hypothetical protein B7R25_03910 [Subtercola boreus]
MASDDTGWIGRTLADRYTITGRIGAGGMSTVYEARDKQLGRAVALKLFNPGEARDDDRRRSEVDVLARLNHPTLVTMYDAHLASGDSAVPSFLVMELVPGPDLRSTLDHGPLRGAIAAQIATDIAEGLAAMHSQGIVHRDLKPANILLSPTGLPAPTHRAKLADFGIAHLVGNDRMTTVGMIVGTASYLSPEQASGAYPGPEADVYALGLVVLEGLTGRREYPGTVVESMSARASRDPVVGDDLPASWVSLLTQMTARDPAARPTALEVAVRSRDIARDLVTWEAGAGAGAEAGAGAGAAAATALLATSALPASARPPQDAPTVALPSQDAPTAATVALHPADSPTAPTVALHRSAAPAVAAAAAAAPPGRVDTPLGDPAEPERPKRRRGALIGALVGAVVLAGAIWVGGTLLTPASNSAPAGPAPATTQTPAPSTEPVVETAAPADGNSSAPEDTAAPTDDSTTPATTPPTTAPASPAPESPAPAPSASAPAPAPAPSPSPSATTGNNGNGNGNNGKGKGNGGNAKG